MTCLNELERIWCWSPFKFWNDAAPASSFGSNFPLKLPIDSRRVFFKRKFNYLQLFQKYRKPNFNGIHAKNVFQIAAENSNVFWAFFNFFFHRMYLFLYPIYFSKIFLLKQRERRSLLDRLGRICCWSPFEILRENWR